MDGTRMLELIRKSGLSVGAAAAALVLAAPGAAAAQTYRDSDGYTQRRVDDAYSQRPQSRQERATYNDWRARELRQQHMETTSYGDVNYDRDLGYGEFSYYGREPEGRYLYEGASPEQRYQTRSAGLPARDPMAGRGINAQDRYEQDRYEQDIDSRRYGGDVRYQDAQYGEAGYQQRGRMPRTHVQFHDYQVRQDAGSRGVYQQPARFDDRSMQPSRQQQYRQPDQRDRVQTGRPGQRDWVSYGDVNYEGDLGYGEFSYYGDNQERRYTAPGATPAGQRMARPGASPDQPVTYYTTDWHEDRTGLDRMIESESGAERRDR